MYEVFQKPVGNRIASEDFVPIQMQVLPEPNSIYAINHFRFVNTAESVL